MWFQLSEALFCLVKLSECTDTLFTTVRDFHTCDVIVAGETLLHFDDESMKDEYEKYLHKCRSPVLFYQLTTLATGESPEWFRVSYFLLSKSA